MCLDPIYNNPPPPPSHSLRKDALVAFARSQLVDIYVHQLDHPVWIIRAVEGRSMDQQVHIAYQSYEHCERRALS